MPSSHHQWLVLWLASRLLADGYFIGGAEGATPQGGLLNHLPLPFEIAGVRPDLWAMAKSGLIAFGEAKTAGDIVNAHTRKQLAVFGQLRLRSGKRLCPLYIAVPRSAASTLDRVLGDLGLAGRRHIARLHVPDCLIKETSLS